MILNTERSPRAITSLDVDIKPLNGELVTALTSNVSIGGFAIQCSMDERNKITPQGDFVDDVKPVDVTLQLHDEDGHKEGVHARCRVIYSRRIAQDKCQIGMNYIELFDDGQSKLMTLIREILR